MYATLDFFIFVNCQSRHWSDSPFQELTNMYQLGLNSVHSAHEGAVSSLFILSVLQNYFVQCFVQSVHKTVLGVILLNSCI